MSSLYRFGVSLDKALIDAFDRYVEAAKYTNRSEAIRDMIREKLVLKKRDDNGLVAGAIVMTYDHHRHELAENLMDTQHDFQSIVISTQHVHLDHDHCLEIIAVRGRAAEVESLAANLRSYLGVEHLSVSLSAFGAHEHEPAHEPTHTHSHEHSGHREQESRH